MDELFALVGILIAFGAFLLVFILPVATFLRASRAVREAQRANERVDALARILQDLHRERRGSGAASVEEPQVAPSVTPAVVTPVVPAPPAFEWGADVSPVAPAVAPPPDVAVAAESRTPDVPTALPVTQAAVTGPEPGDTTSGDTSADAAPPQQAPPVDAPPRPPRERGVAAHPSLEQRIGQRWLLYAGVAALVLGASYIVKYAFDNDWITPGMRVVLSALGGAALVAAGLRFARNGLRFFGFTLAGGGFAVVYVAVYAALNLYALVDRNTAFALMGVVTALAAALADRLRAQPIAMVAMIGGFATPWLVGGDSQAYVPLFTYISVLIGGSAFLARRHDWPLLTLATFLLTVFTFSAWAAFAYRDSRYLGVQFFLTLWLAAFVASVWYAPERLVSEEDDERPAQGGALATGVRLIVGITAPLLYHGASLANLLGHSRDLLVYFIAATLAGILYSADGRRPWARLVTWVAVWGPLVGWLTTRLRPAGALVTVLAIFGLHLMNELRVFLRERERLSAIDTLLLHLNGLGLLAALLALHPRWDTDAMAVTVALVGVFYLALAAVMRPRHAFAPLHYLALATACFAGALALRYEGAWVTVGWAVEGAFLVWLGLRERRQWLRIGGWILLALGLWHGLEHISAPAPVTMTPWLNAPALSIVAIAAMLLWIATLYKKLGWELPGESELPVGGAIILAAAAGLIVVTEQINGMFGMFAWQRQSQAGPMAAGAADLARQVTISIVWAAYAVGLLVAGMVRRYPLARYLAIILFAVTIAKVFFVDLAQLDRIYRIMSVVGLGLLLVLASFLYQRFMTGEEET